MTKQDHDLAAAMTQHKHLPQACVIDRIPNVWICLPELLPHAVKDSLQLEEQQEEFRLKPHDKQMNEDMFKNTCLIFSYFRIASTHQI